MKSYFYLVFGSLGIAALDLGTKFLVEQYYVAPIDYSPWFSFALAHNQGLAWGFEAPVGLIALASFLAIAFLLWLFVKKSNSAHPLTIIAFALILGGALGNLYERVMYGEVTDFVSILSIPNFNLADTALTLGMILFLTFYSVIFPPYRG